MLNQKKTFDQIYDLFAITTAQRYWTSSEYAAGYAYETIVYSTSYLYFGDEEEKNYAYFVRPFIAF